MKLKLSMKLFYCLLLIINILLVTKEIWGVSYCFAGVAPQKFSAVVINSDTGEILYANEAKALRYPASLTKVMTLYLTFKALEDKKLNWNTKLKVSKKAAAAQPSKLGLKFGDYITVEDAVLSLIIKSANDSAIVIAETLAGTESNFANIMNIEAKRLGLNNTFFCNASGWHNEKHVSTAIDVATLAIYLKRHFPNYYKLFSLTYFNYKGGKIESYNNMVKTYPGANGLKTGYTSLAGYNLATSAASDNNQITAVIMGMKNTSERDKVMVRLLDENFRKIELISKMQAGLIKRKPIIKKLA